MKVSRKLLPRTLLVIDMDNGTIRSHAYWNYEREEFGSYEASAERFRVLLEDSIRIRLRSDVSIGCLLSGGLDSSAIAVICRELQATKVETFSVISDDKKFSEEKFIDEVSAYTGVCNHKLAFNCPDLFSALSAALIHSDEPVVSFSVAAQYNIFRLIKQQSNVTVLLSGQGADEILMGYAKFFFFYLNSLVNRRNLATAAKELLTSVIRGTVVRQFRIAEARRYLPWMNSAPYGGALRLGPSYLAEPIWKTQDLRQRQIADIDHYSVPALAHYEDRNSMAHSLEVRHPFLDHRLVNFVTSLPAAYKIRNGWTKYILRDSVPELPKAIRWRKDKQGFVTAEEKWIRHDMIGLVKNVFKNSVLSQMGIIDEAKFLKYYDKVLAGGSAHYGDISRALIAELWASTVLTEKHSSSMIAERAFDPSWRLAHSS